MNTKIKALKLYNFREQWGFCSGTDLHAFFFEELGEPSPSGKKLINKASAKAFIKSGLKTMAHNSPSPKMKRHCAKARFMTLFL